MRVATRAVAWAPRACPHCCDCRQLQQRPRRRYPVQRRPHLFGCALLVQRLQKGSTQYASDTVSPAKPTAVARMPIHDLARSTPATSSSVQNTACGASKSRVTPTSRQAIEVAR